MEELSGYNLFHMNTRNLIIFPTQEGGGVTIPGGVPEPWGCGTEGRGQWAWRDGLGLGLGILEVLSNLNDSVIL